jgi:hypothetical protein
VLVPQFAGFPCGAAVVLLLKIVPVCWNRVLCNNGIPERVIPTEPTREQVNIVLLPVTSALLLVLHF